jgi:hypothetical protein
LDSTRQGTVRIGHEEYITSSVVNDSYIYTTAYENDSGIRREFRSKCFPIDQVSYSNQHAECYDQVVQDLSGLYQTQNHCFSIKKNNQGVPIIYNNDIKLPILLSITHHGLFGAYAYIKI